MGNLSSFAAIEKSLSDRNYLESLELSLDFTVWINTGVAWGILEGVTSSCAARETPYADMRQVANYVGQLAIAMIVTGFSISAKCWRCLGYFGAENAAVPPIQYMSIYTVIMRNRNKLASLMGITRTFWLGFHNWRFVIY